MAVWLIGKGFEGAKVGYLTFDLCYGDTEFFLSVRSGLSTPILKVFPKAAVQVC